MTSEKIRLLIAEDQPLIRRALAALFEAEADVEVVAQAGDGAEAVRMARAWSPDVALLDIKMPRLMALRRPSRSRMNCPR
jgi:DNA-binding NarL/FixJ family response regulator